VKLSAAVPPATTHLRPCVTLTSMSSHPASPTNSGKQRPLRVAIVHHQPMVRLGVAAMLEFTPDVDVVGNGDSHVVVPRTASGEPDVDVLVAPQSADDVAVSTLLDEIAGRVPVLAIICPLTDEENLVNPRTGVLGCVPAFVTSNELATAIRTVARRRYYIPAPAARRADPTGKPDPATLGDAQLSPRERQALALIAQGYTHYQVARRMGVAKSTVETYVERIRVKLRLGNKAQLTHAALSLLAQWGPTDEGATSMARQTAN